MAGVRKVPRERKDKTMKKKILAMLLASTMVMGMTMGVNAEEVVDKKPEAKDTGKATILNVEAGAEEKITVYQLVDAVYNEHGLVDYKRDNGLTEADLDNIYAPTYAEIMAIAKKTLTPYTALEDAETPTNIIWEYDEENGSYSTDLEAGMYLVKISATGAKVYNPMIISIGYDEDKSGIMNQLVPGKVDAEDDWKVAEAIVAAKSSEITGKKEVDADDVNAAVGSLVDFTITTTIPSYSAANESVTFDVIDTIVNGLDYAPAGDSMAAPAVTVGGVAVSAGEDTYEFIYTEGTKTFTISFDSAYILGLADETEEARKVVITYDAVVTDEAIAEVAENALSLKYTTAQGEVTTEGVEKDKEYVYTVTLEGVFDKIDESGAKLSGAIFELYEKADASEAVVDEELQTGYVELEDGKYGKDIDQESTSSADDGSLSFDGLDADKTYYLKETKAPAGYTLNDTVYTITFDNFADTNDDDVYDQYEVFVDGVRQGIIVYGESLSDGSSIEITNTKLIALPSTGGIGTTIFTVAGCAIMIAAAGFFFATRKKEEE